MSVHVSRSIERKMAFAGGSHISTQNARTVVVQCDVCDHVYFLVFRLPVTFHVRRWTQLKVCERRNLHIPAGLELRSFDFVIWSNWTQIATSMGLQRPQVVVLTILDSSQSACYGILWKNARMWDYRYLPGVGQRASVGNYLGRSLTNHNMFHLAKLALDSDQVLRLCWFS